VAHGLAVDEAAHRLVRYGANVLPEARQRSAIAVVLAQFASPLIYLLFAAAAVALVLGRIGDAAVIAFVVVLNAIIGAFQEGRAERALVGLRRLATHAARVVRDDRELVVAARDVVPGDLLVVEAGDAIAADARLVASARLAVSEAALTGESMPVSKQAEAVAADTPLADRRDMLHAGTLVTAGTGRAIVVATGVATEIGHIAALAENAKPAPTPLEARVAQFGRHLAIAGAILFAAIVGLGLVRGMPLVDVVMVGISQIVGMIPEGLPVAMTIALAVGVQRMSRRRTVVRQLTAVETLGSTTVVCSDKTGTLTRNELTATAIVLPDGRELAVTGTGYAPLGEISGHGEDLHELLEACVLCNDAQLQASTDGWQTIGDPTEVALLALAIKGGVLPGEVRARYPRTAEQPFDPQTKLMATEHAGRVIVKGAPEEVLALCGGAVSARTAADALAARALRVLAIAVVEGGTLAGGLRGARLLGLVGEIDPPRPEVTEAVARCRAAGVRVVMLTGDHAATASAIARQLGIAGDDRIVTGAQLERMSDAELAGASVFARVQPAQKLRIVEALQRRGDVVAMTGDGVNDAPALALADVGVAMGSGTEVAKEAAKIVIADDNFTTIIAAIEEGRVVYRNIKKAILLLFSTSTAEVVVLLVAMLLGYPAPFAAVQILWNNLVTEGLTTVNLVLEPPEGNEMRQPPIARDEPFLTRTLFARFLVMVPAISIATLGWFLARTAQGVPAAVVQTETFTLLAICEWFNVLNCRSETRSALTWRIFKNRWLVGGLLAANALQVAAVFWSPLAAVIHTVPIDPPIVIALGVVGSSVLWVEELRKWRYRAASRKCRT
jgi:Ca2+-transporting ATPase